AYLLLVGVVGEELHGERVVGMVLVPGVEGGLVRVLLRAGQRPDGQARRGAGTTGGLLPASAGAEPGEDGQRQAEAGERRATGGVHHCFLLKTDRHGPKNFRKTTAGPCKLIRLTSAVKISPASNGHDPVSRRRRARRAARSSGPSGGGGGGSAAAVGQLPGLLLRLQRELHGLEGVLLGHRVLGAAQHVE